ncbi:MAG TPA: septum formation initiator family protein [Aquella sp.]|nr:septum formation initiator family protein [Aquella sp.]
MQKFLFIFLCVMIAWFIYQSKYGRGGNADDLQIIKQINKQTVLNRDLSERNNRMVMQIAGLKGSADSIEQRSREELNMIKNGETLVMLPGNDLLVEEKAEEKKAVNKKVVNKK